MAWSRNDGPIALGCAEARLGGAIWLNTLADAIYVKVSFGESLACVKHDIFRTPSSKNSEISPKKRVVATRNASSERRI